MKRRLLILLCLGCAGRLPRGDAARVCGPGQPGGTAQLHLDHVQRIGAVEQAGDGVAQQRYAFQPAAHRRSC